MRKGLCVRDPSGALCLKTAKKFHLHSIFDYLFSSHTSFEAMSHSLFFT